MYGFSYSLVLVGGGLGKGMCVGVGVEIGVLEDLGVEEWQI